MHYLIRKPWIFPTRQRRRVKRLIIALGVFTAFNMAYSGLVAHAAAQQSAFKELTAPSNFVAEPVGKKGKATYSVSGTGIRFEFRRDQRDGELTILCGNGAQPCGETLKLRAERGTGGDLLFRTTSGEAVLRLTSAGGGTLFGGASVIPGNVPKTGAAFVRD